ncbi:hypothetical protein [Hymenobacter jeollabukensis]|uniref:Uncharacterized protein n=1 Tax=Hymenobacter jeollabukensis TaxID=2025313 RepID=A0A5R8WMB8_9BACT|nr:hypothetical protein [Hymenobacter jeollabukensis]TLM90037.1 hypothetical protein FDY95_18630 [Hymenobacter jeollabukensis]
MPITRNSDQRSKTLEEFYEDFAANKGSTYAADYVAGGRDMLAFVAMINRTFGKTQLWGLTSLARLVIQAEDDWKSPWYIIVAASAMPGQYLFEYRLPPERAPWPGATVNGEAKSLNEAERYLLIAMRECEGWADNQELQQLLTKSSLL